MRRTKRNGLKYVHFRVAFCLSVKTSLRAKPFIWKCVPPIFHFHANQTHFTQISARGFVLKRRHKVTRKKLVLIVL